MKNKMNASFLEAYIRLDGLCSHKFGVKFGGVTEYVNRLINARFAPGRDEVLPALVKYQNMRNKIMHDESVQAGDDRITRDDIKWLNRFANDVVRKRDPISVYLRRARGYVRRRGLLRALLVILGVAVVIGGVFLYLNYIK